MKGRTLNIAPFYVNGEGKYLLKSSGDLLPVICRVVASMLERHRISGVRSSSNSKSKEDSEGVFSLAVVSFLPVEKVKS
jgi:hypothetical protein